MLLDRMARPDASCKYGFRHVTCGGLYVLKAFLAPTDYDLRFPPKRCLGRSGFDPASRSHGIRTLIDRLTIVI